jgi:hypothetical protein
MESNLTMTETEWRRTPRRKIDPLPVSIAHRRASRLVEKWHLGEITEVSTTGARVQMVSAFSFDIGTPIELLCFPDNAKDDDLHSTPTRLTAVVIWKNETSLQIGIEFTS